MLLKPDGEAEIALAEAADAFMLAVDSLPAKIAQRQEGEHVAGQLRFQLGLDHAKTYTHHVDAYKEYSFPLVIKETEEKRAERNAKIAKRAKLAVVNS